MKNNVCCEGMCYYIDNHCDVHNSSFECPDCIIHYEPTTETYGIIIHDGGESYVKINFCPWCGATLNIDSQLDH